MKNPQIKCIIKKKEKSLEAVLQHVYFEGQHFDRKSFILSSSDFLTNVSGLTERQSVRKFFHPAGTAEEEEEEASPSSQLSSWTQQTSGAETSWLPGIFTHRPPTAAAPPPASGTHGESTVFCPALWAAWPWKLKKNPRGLLLSLLAECGSQCGGGGTVCGRDISTIRQVSSVYIHYIRFWFSK